MTRATNTKAPTPARTGRSLRPEEETHRIVRLNYHREKLTSAFMPF